MWLFKKIRKWTRLYDKYDAVSEYFVKPSLRFRIDWKGWIRKPILYLAKYNQYEWRGRKWDEDFLKTCSKFGRWWRSFIKPYYLLPRFFKFGVENYGLGYKLKYDSWCFEHDPVFAIVLFGVKFEWRLVAPLVGEDYIQNKIYEDSQNNVILWKIHPDSGSYWETILEVGEHGLEEGLRRCGVSFISRETEKMKEKNKITWEKIKNTKDPKELTKLHKKLKHVSLAWFRCSPEYVKPKHLNKWEGIYQEIKQKNKDYLWYR